MHFDALKLVALSLSFEILQPEVEVCTALSLLSWKIVNVILSLFERLVPERPTPTSSLSSSLLYLSARSAHCVIMPSSPRYLATVSLETLMAIFLE